MADFRKVEANLPGYLRSSQDTDVKRTRKIAENLKAEELGDYKLLLEGASRRSQIDRDLYEFVLTLIDNWEGSSFHQRITVGLLLKQVQGDTRLWDVLFRNQSVYWATGPSTVWRKAFRKWLHGRRK